MSLRSLLSRACSACVLLAAVLLLGGRAVSHAQSSPSVPDLFRPAPADAGAVQPQSAATISSRLVAVNLDLLADPSGAPALRLPLQDDRVVEVRRDRQTAVAGGALWTGRVAGASEGQVVLAQVGGALVGNIVLSAGERYHLRHAGPGLDRLERVDQGRFPNEAPPVLPSAAELALAATEGAADPAARPAVTAADDCGRIDVLVVYDAAARMAAGGADAMLAEIHLGVAETNVAYANSGITQRVSLVHAAERAVAIGASANSALTNLKADAGVAALRNSYGADLVSYWVATLPGACGIAYKMNTVSSSFAPFGYSVVDRDCATGYYSFGHEMGHNMGADHDWFVAAGTSPSSTAHGVVNVGARWRTIMAYNDLCQAQTPSVNCSRLPYFSNPAVKVGGAPTGFSAGTGTGCTVGNTGNPNCDADNHAVLNGSACTVAAFRDTSPGRSDVWMKDTWGDTGREPDPATAGQAMWLSPYVWIRTAADPGLVHQHEHQNPESAWANHVFVKLHNGGGAAAGGRLKLYYARASTGLAWPANWTQFADLAVTVPANSTGVASAVWNTTATQTGHFCLLARWVSASDPMTAAETSNVDQNTRNNNNIVWRTVNIVNLQAPDGLQQTVSFIVRNTGKERARLGLAFTWPTGEGANQLPFQRQGQAVIRLGERLQRAIASGDTNGLEPLGDGRYVLVDPKGSRLAGLDLDAGEEDAVEVTFEARPETVGTDPRAFRLEAAQFTEGQADPVGGVAWEITVRPPRSEMGTVRGVVFHDRNGNAVREDEEPGLPERTVVFTDADGQKTEAHSDAGGAYALQLAPGTYQVSQVLPGGWAQTSPADATMDFDAGGGQRVWELSFGSWQPTEQPSSCKPPARLVNLSTRGFVGRGDGVMIAGFIIRDRPARVVVRAGGPSLARQGVAGTLADPILQVYSGQTMLAESDDWTGGATAADLKASGLAPADAKEPGLVLTLKPGAYTAIIRGAGEGTGVALVEVFQID